MKLHIIHASDRRYIFNPLSMQIYEANSSELDTQSLLGSLDSDTLCTLFEDQTIEYISNHYDPAYEINLLLTGNCNLDCSYCFAKETYRSQKTLNFSESMTVLGWLLESPGLKFIKFFGGEPLLEFGLLKKYVKAIRKLCDKRKASVPRFGLVTNGLLLKSDVISYLRENDFAVTVSIDGINQPLEVLQQRYKKRNLTPEIIGNILEACRKNFKLNVQSTYTNKHFSYDISPFDIFLEFQDLGINCIHIMPAFGDFSNLKESETKWLLSEFRKAAYESIISLVGKKPLLLVYNLKILSRILGISRGYFICGAGIDSLAIMPSGKAYPCYLLDHPSLEIFDSGSIDEETLKQKLNQTRERFVEYRKTRLPKCRECWISSLCASCFGPSFIASQSLTTPNDMFCKILQATTEGCLLGLVKLKADDENWNLFLENLVESLATSGQPILNVDTPRSRKEIEKWLKHN